MVLHEIEFRGTWFWDNPQGSSAKRADKGFKTIGQERTGVMTSLKLRLDIRGNKIRMFKSQAMVIRSEGGKLNMRVWNTNAPTKTNANRNIRKLLKRTCFSKKFFPFVPDKWCDNGGKSTRGCIPVLDAHLHSGSRGDDGHMWTPSNPGHSTRSRLAHH